MDAILRPKTEADVDVYLSFPISGRAAPKWSWGAGRKFRGAGTGDSEDGRPPRSCTARRIPGLPGPMPRLALCSEGLRAMALVEVHVEIVSELAESPREMRSRAHPDISAAN